MFDVCADNTDVVRRHTSFCCFGSCYILGENSWGAQTSFCCHRWTGFDLHLCCFDVFYFSPQCQCPNDHCSVLQSFLGRCSSDILRVILNFTQCQTFAWGCLYSDDRHSSQLWTSVSVRWRSLVWRHDQRYLVMFLLGQPKNVQRLASEQCQTYLIRYVQRWVTSS